MAGFISNSHSTAPPDAWSNWRDAIALANAGLFKLADQLVRDVLADPKVPDVLREMAQKQQRDGWPQPRPTFTQRLDQPTPF